MKLSIFLNIAAFATVLATPLNERILRRQSPGKGSQPPKFITGSAGTAVTPDVTAGKPSNVVQYSSNWAGAVLTAPPSGATFDAVYGVFTVPTPSPPRGATSGTYAASIWVGIDGDTVQQSILQAGIDVTATVSTTRGRTTTSLSYDSWYEWYPNYATDFSISQFSFKAGDQIALNVTSSSSSKGVVVLSNLSTRKSVTFQMSSPSTAANLAGKNAEWIVEDFQQGGKLVPFVNFGTVQFTGCAATYNGTTKGTLGTTNAQVLEIKNSSGNVLTAVTIPNSNSLKVVYSG